MTRYDKLLIGVVLITAFALFIAAKVINDTGQQRLYAMVMVDGKEYRRIDLKNEEPGEFIVHTSAGYNVIEIGKNKVRIKEASCPDKMCVKQGWISRPNQMTVCLPNRVYVKIIGGKDKIDDISF